MQEAERGDCHSSCHLAARQRNLEQAMQDRAHQDSGNASALATSMQLAAHAYYMQMDKADNRKGSVQRNRVSANYLSGVSLWQQEKDLRLEIGELIPQTSRTAATVV